MKQIEYLISRLIYLVEDNPCTVIKLTVTVGNNKEPEGWSVTVEKLEGLPKEKNVV